MILALGAQAQTVSFDNADYSTVGVYDTWEQSPFRTGKLSGNAKVIDNHLTAEDGPVVNKTAKILGVQRSRFGSNTFGVRVDLQSPVATSETVQYVHVLVNKPTTSDVMLVGLGKRETEAFGDEPTTVEQFWVTSGYSYSTPDQWTDMVFPIQTVTGVKVYSLVIVPDLKSPHNYDADFACYVDQIEINSDGEQRIGTFNADGTFTKSADAGDYPVNFDKMEKNTRTGDNRYLSKISLTGQNDAPSYSYELSKTEYEYLYKDLTGTQVWDVRAGQTFKPAVTYNHDYMNAYLYIDYNQDGKFMPVLTSDGKNDKSTSEAVSFSSYGPSKKYYDSDGKQLTSILFWEHPENTLKMPTFTIPSDTKPGIYRMRFKVDWNCIDPAGGDGSDSKTMQSIVDNGGAIVDVLLNVHNDNVTISGSWRNGYLITSDGKDLQGFTQPFKTALDILVKPNAGFDADKIVVRHGYNLNGKQYVHNNRQWQTETHTASEFGSDGSYTLAADIFDGDVNVDGYFVEKKYIDLYDTSEMPVFNDGQANVKLHRTFSTKNLNTVCLPFALSHDEITAAFGSVAVAYRYTEYDAQKNVINFKTVAAGSQTEANEPFLLKTTTDADIFTFEDIDVSYTTAPGKTNDGYDFVGNYAGKITIPSGAWFINSNMFYQSVGKSTMKGYRGYFVGHGQEAKSLGLGIDDVVSSIDGVHGAAPADADADTYNMSGQRVDGGNLQQGVYVKGGRKVVIK